jgi:hypothetical protein
MPTSFNTPKQWRSRAKEARALARQMRDPESKRALVRVAESYAKIAQRAEARLPKKAKKPARRVSGSLPRTSSPRDNKPSAVATAMHIETPAAAKGVEILPHHTGKKKPRR